MAVVEQVRFSIFSQQEIQELQNDINFHKLECVVRNDNDIKILIKNPVYLFGRMLLKLMEPFHRNLKYDKLHPWQSRVAKFLRNPKEFINYINRIVKSDKI